MTATRWKTTLTTALVLVLVGCSSVGGLGGPAGQVRGGLRMDLPVAATAADQAPAAEGSVQADLQAVVQRANDEQQRAFSQHDPSVMRDTATDGYYEQLVQTNRDLADAGVAAIRLVALEWGPISVDGATAQVTTYETWRTTYADGATEQARERNVYALVNQDGVWKIQDDAHPDSDVDQPAADTAPAPSGAPIPPPGRAPAGSGHSVNWSGYAASSGTFTAVSGTWIVPQVVTSGSFGGDATWVGIGGLRNRDLIQAGTDAAVDGRGRVRYEAWIETLPRPSHQVPLTVSPGDSVTVSIAEQSPGQWLVSLKNNTTGQSYNDTEQYTSSHSSAEWVEEAPSGGRRVLPLDNFGTVSFSNGSAVKDGQTVSVAQSGAQPITMIDRSGQALATPSALGSDGASFSVSRTGTLAPGSVNPAPVGPPAPSRGRGNRRPPFGGRSPFGF